MSSGHQDPSVQNIILDSIADGVFTVDQDWKITSFNRAAEKITGVPREQAIGQPCKAVFRANICESECSLRDTIQTGCPMTDKRVEILDAGGSRKPISVSTAILKDEAGHTLGGVETFRDLTTIVHLQKRIQKDYRFEDILSRNHRMQELFEFLPEIAATSSTVLIEGETGTGKELVARAIHNLSPRRGKRFVAVNCGALQDTLLESELFGYKAGAFTDARKDKLGRIALAQGGTLFLDEIGDISPAMQMRLLRFLQERAYEPLGSVQTLTSNVRVVAATNQNLQDLVKEHRFREDLYYRVNVVKLDLPPLRERKEDIPLLVDHFINHFNSLQGRDVKGISKQALACMMAHDFPGNIRELENIVERALILCHSDEIELAHLHSSVCPACGEDAGNAPRPDSLKQVEAAFLMNTLSQNGWNRAKTARQLGIHKTTLYRKMKALGIEAPPSRNKS